MSNSKCTHHACDEEDEHSPNCTAWNRRASPPAMPSQPSGASADLDDGAEPSWRTSDISWICSHLTECTAFSGARLQREWDEMKRIALSAAPVALPGVQEDETGLRALLESEFACYKTVAGLIPWAINALLDNSPHRAAPAPPLAQPVQDEREAFEKSMNDARFFPAELCFALTKSPSGRDEYANSHLESNWNGWQARAALATKTAPPAEQGDARDAAAILRELVELRNLKAEFDAKPHMQHVYWMREKLTAYNERWPAAWDAADAALKAMTPGGGA